ncbi:hypothetical protein [Streptomyces sp. G45]|uniref:hypothetical protein n=1 Tax=Streptomyces sp. G45 TaxID=3406627 RepID=UPI003C2187EA
MGEREASMPGGARDRLDGQDGRDRRDGLRRGPWAAAAGVAALAAVLYTTAPPGTARAAEKPQPYAFAEDAPTVPGTPSGTGSRTLLPGSYRSAIKHPGPTGTTELYYRLELNRTDNAYVSVTALPSLGSRVGYADGITVSVQDANGFLCDSGEAHFGSSRSPRPLTASALRDAGGDSRCARAGTYYLVVERTTPSRTPGSTSTEKPSTPEEWDLELYVASEPGLARPAATTAPLEADPENPPSPAPPTGAARPRAGGTSFASAPALAKGVWDDRVKPGQTRYYRVPVDWGQRLSATVELGGSAEPRTGASGGRTARGTRGDDFVSGGLVVSLFNPARRPVDDVQASYDGRQRSADLPALPPVAYENRYARLTRASEVRFAGWYYLAVHLSPDVAPLFGDDPVGLTLRVDVSGKPRRGPAYAGEARPENEFAVTERDEDAAREGSAADGPAKQASGVASDAGDDAGDEAMMIVAAAGIGTGTVLVAVLGVWTLVARRGRSA